jgi:hypothetical protein
MRKAINLKPPHKSAFEKARLHKLRKNQRIRVRAFFQACRNCLPFNGLQALRWESLVFPLTDDS